MCFAINFCILTFPLGGFIRNMNILLGDILLIFIPTSEEKKGGGVAIVPVAELCLNTHIRHHLAP